MLVPVDRLRVLVDRELDRKNNFINFTLYILNYDPELSIETKRKEEEEKKKRMKNQCDKGTFLFFFYPSLSSKRTWKIEKTKVEKERRRP